MILVSAAKAVRHSATARVVNAAAIKAQAKEKSDFKRRTSNDMAVRWSIGKLSRIFYVSPLTFAFRPVSPRFREFQKSSSLLFLCRVLHDPLVCFSSRAGVSFRGCDAWQLFWRTHRQFWQPDSPRDA